MVTRPQVTYQTQKGGLHSVKLLSSDLPTPSQNLHAIAKEQGVHPFTVYRNHGGFPPLEQDAKAPAREPKNQVAAKSVPMARQSTHQNMPENVRYIRVTRPSWYMRKVWPYWAILTPLRTAIRKRKEYIIEQERLALEGKPCVPPWLL